MKANHHQRREMVNRRISWCWNQIVAPLVPAVVPAEVAPGDVAAGLGAASADRQRLDDLSQELDSLRTTVERQERPSPG
jgi:hypothetical protein